MVYNIKFLTITNLYLNNLHNEIKELKEKIEKLNKLIIELKKI
jgi:hypothetical protein